MFCHWLYYCARQLWDASTSQTLLEYEEHEKRAWSVDFSRADPTKLASGSDDGCVKLWSINQVSGEAVSIRYLRAA